MRHDAHHTQLCSVFHGGQDNDLSPLCSVFHGGQDNDLSPLSPTASFRSPFRPLQNKLDLMVGNALKSLTSNGVILQRDLWRVSRASACSPSRQCAPVRVRLLQAHQPVPLVSHCAIVGTASHS